MIQLLDVIQDAQALAQGKKPSLKYALWIAACSPMQKLSVNGRLARILAKYVLQPLPEKQALFAELKTAKGLVFGSTVNALYTIENWYNSKVINGTLQEYENIGTTYNAQCLWRTKVTAEIHGVGLKCVSFAALIFSPMTCEIVPLDRHHLNRLGYGKVSIASRKEYLRIEAYLLQEQTETTVEEMRSVPLALYAWYCWETYRQSTGASKIHQGVESHLALSCRNY